MGISLVFLMNTVHLKHTNKLIGNNISESSF